MCVGVFVWCTCVSFEGGNQAAAVLLQLQDGHLTRLVPYKGVPGLYIEPGQRLRNNSPNKQMLIVINERCVLLKSRHQMCQLLHVMFKWKVFSEVCLRLRATFTFPNLLGWRDHHETQSLPHGCRKEEVKKQANFLWQCSTKEKNRHLILPCQRFCIGFKSLTHEYVFIWTIPL